MDNRTLRNQRGLTLIEVLIVIILMGIIAAVAVPRFSNTTSDALENSMDSNLGSLRSTIELYAAQHGGRYPGQFKEIDGTTAVATDAEASAAFIAQLTLYSDALGKTSTTKDTANYPYGPYFREGIPKNPLPSTSSDVAADWDELGNIFNTGAIGGTGWKVAVQTGQIIANNDNYDDR